jgi:hypothetical protein
MAATVVLGVKAPKPFNPAPREENAMSKSRMIALLPTALAAIALPALSAPADANPTLNFSR